MRCLLAIIANHTRSVSQLDAAIRRRAELALPPSDYAFDRYLTQCDSLGFYTWTNEPGDAAIEKSSRHIRMRSGYSGDQLTDPTDFTQADGIFLDFSLDPVERAVTVSNCVTRLEPAYWVHSQECTLIGNRALLLNLLTHTDRTPSYDLDALASLVCLGWFADESTPFQNVQVLPANTVLRATPGQRPILRELDDSLAVGIGRELGDTPDYREMANALLDACLPLRTSSPTAALTGGKDSRLIVAALKAAGVEFTATTAGFPDDPDVLVAVQVAKALGIPHRVSQPKTRVSNHRRVIEVDPLGRTASALRVSDGMLSGYENLPRPGPYDARVSIGGHGGEILRGGYAKNVATHDYSGVMQFWRNTLYGPGGELLTPSVRSSYTDRLGGWLVRQSGHLAPIDLLDRYYLEFRCGRWSAAARAAYTLRRRLLQPLFDNRLIKLAQRIQCERRYEDRVIHGILSQLAPTLVDIPFAQDKWKFAPAGDMSGFAGGRSGRASPTGPSAFNWRLDSSLAPVLAGRVLEAPSLLFDVVDRRRIDRVFAEESWDPRLAWNLYSLAVLLSNDWLHEPTGRNVQIEVPNRDQG
jgi:hypothetical protein